MIPFGTLRLKTILPNKYFISFLASHSGCERVRAGDRTTPQTARGRGRRGRRLLAAHPRRRMLGPCTYKWELIQFQVFMVIFESPFVRCSVDFLDIGSRHYPAFYLHVRMWYFGYLSYFEYCVFLIGNE